MQQEKISKYGYGFQLKIITSIMTDATFTSQVFDLLKTDYFESESIKFLVDRGLEYFKQQKKIPTLEVYKVFIETIGDDLLKQEIIGALRTATQYVGANDLEFIKETTLDFCKNQAIRSAILESVDYLKMGNYDEIKRVIDKAMRVGLDSEIGLEYFDNIDRRYEENSRDPISTGWDTIDEMMKGGLAAGELGVCIAPSGAGKSWLLAKIGASALLSGKTVLHYTLELSEDYTGWRYDCILSGISLDKIKNHKEDVKKKLMEIKEKSGGDLIIKEYPTKSISLMGIRSHITKLKMLGTSPDIVVIDYADLLKFGNSTMAKHEALEQLYEEIRGFAGELQIPIWTVSQSNKSGLDGDIVEAESAAGAYAKIFTADFVMSLSRKAQDKLSNTGRIHIIKNRFGVDGITFPVFMDPSRGAIDIFAAGTDGARNATNQMQTDTQYNRQRLKQRYQQINGNFLNIENKNVEF